MGLLNIQDLRADMVLAEDLKDRSGRLLMSKGTVLTDKYLKICKVWGIVEVLIEGVSKADIHAAAMKDFDSATIAAVSETVRQRFSCTDTEHPAINELLRLCILRTAEGKISDLHYRKESCSVEEETGTFAEKLPLPINPAKFITENTKLSTLPDIYRQIIDAIAKPSSSAYDIENVINKDTNLAARLLKIVNSAFYAYPSKIDTLSRAVNIVGTKQLSTLAIGVNVISMFNDIPNEIINMKMFWKHSILCGICARLLAGYKNIQNTERLFVIGLLHDIGRLVMYNQMPKESLFAVVRGRTNRRILYLVERDLFGLDHAAIGGELLTKWRMPMSLEDAVKYHHEPQRANHRTDASIVHIGDIIANSMAMGTSGEVLIPPLDKEAWTQVGLTPNILSLSMEQADRQLKEIFELVYSDDNARKKN